MLRPAPRLPGLQAGRPAVVDGLLTLTNGKSCIPEVHNVLLAKYFFRHPVDGIDRGPPDGLSGGVAVLIKHHLVCVCEHRLKEPHEVEGGDVRDSDGRSPMQSAGMANSQREMPLVRNAAQVCLRSRAVEPWLVETVPFTGTVFSLVCGSWSVSVVSVGRVFVLLSWSACPGGMLFCGTLFFGRWTLGTLERIFTGSSAGRRLPGSNFLTTPDYCRLDTTCGNGYERCIQIFWSRDLFVRVEVCSRKEEPGMKRSPRFVRWETAHPNLRQETQGGNQPIRS